MREPTLLKISLLLSVSGLIGMVLVVNFIGYEKTPIKSISQDHIGKGVTLCGNVEKKFSSRKGHTFFNLTDGSGSIGAVIFNDTKTEPFGNNDEICVSGEVGFYQNSLEITVKYIKYV